MKSRVTVASGPITRSTEQRQTGEVFGMAVALDDLARSRLGLQAQHLARMRLHRGRQVSESPDRSGDLPVRDRRPRRFEPLAPALELVEPDRQLVPKGDRL